MSRARSRSGSRFRSASEARRSVAEASEPRQASEAFVRVKGAVIVHALGNHSGRHLCGGVALDARVQPIPIQTLEPKLRLEAYEEILRELGEMRVALARVAGGGLTIEICHGCEYNAESGKVGTERAIALLDQTSAAKLRRSVESRPGRDGSAAADMVSDFESEEDT